MDEDSQLSETFRVPDPLTGQMRRLISQISPKEEEMFRNMIRRLNTIVKVRSLPVFPTSCFSTQSNRCYIWFHFQTAAELDVRIMVDAEQTYFQPAISRITLEMMRKYNKDKAIVFNTYQCYLREAFREVNPSLSFYLFLNLYNWFIVSLRLAPIWSRLVDRTSILAPSWFVAPIWIRSVLVLRL